MDIKNNETNSNKKEIPFLGEIKTKEVNLREVYSEVLLENREYSKVST